MRNIREVILFRKFISAFTSVYDSCLAYERKKARYTAFFMSILILYMIPSIILEVLWGNFNSTAAFYTAFYYGFIAFLLILLKRGHIHFVTLALMTAGLMKAVEYFFNPMSFVFYVHIALALLMAAAIHIRKYQLYLSYILFNGLALLRIPFALYLIERGTVDSEILYQSILAIFGCLFISFTINFLSGIIDREIEESAKLDRIASTDSLTGLANRRKLEHHFKKSLMGNSKALMVMDIDFFKSVNDDFGHDRGDEVLKDFAGILKGVLRETDSCYRWGGEEFVAVLKGLSTSEAGLIAERLRKAVEGADFRLGRPLTISIGLTGSHSQNEALEPMLKRADRAMYRAKQKGRNRIEEEPV